MAAYDPTVWVNETSPALSAANLNKLTDELETQASEISLSHSLPTWANGVAPALTDAAPLNEMERVLQAVAADVGLSYTPTVWESGWIPGRNSYRFNKMEQQAVVNRNALDSQTPGDLLRWAPPIDNTVPVVEFTLTDATRNSSTLLDGQGRDLRINQTGIVTSGAMAQIGGTSGWRNIEWIGGDLNITTGSDLMALPIRNTTGTVHLEGINFRGDSVADYIVARLGNESVWHIQNCRVENNDIGGEHADCFQSQQGNIAFLGFDKCTFIVEYQGIFLRNATASSYIRGGEINRCNFKLKSPGISIATYLWITDEDPQTGGPAIGNFDISDTWAAPTSDTAVDIYPNRLFQDFKVSGNYVNRQGSFVLTDSEGQYIRPSKPSDVVPAGGSLSGQAALDAGWTGTIRIGSPPDGDFAPASILGLNYSSPGYQS